MTGRAAAIVSRSFVGSESSYSGPLRSITSPASAAADQRHVGPGDGPVEGHIPEAQLPRPGHEVGLLDALADDADPHVARHEARRLEERADALGEPDGSRVDEREGLVPAELSPSVDGREPAVEAVHVDAIRDVLDPSRCGSSWPRGGRRARGSRS